MANSSHGCKRQIQNIVTVYQSKATIREALSHLFVLTLSITGLQITQVNRGQSERKKHKLEKLKARKSEGGRGEAKENTSCFFFTAKALNNNFRIRTSIINAILSVFVSLYWKKKLKRRLRLDLRMSKSGAHENKIIHKITALYFTLLGNVNEVSDWKIKIMHNF